jgi:hypothetical protein
MSIAESYIKKHILLLSNFPYFEIMDAYGTNMLSVLSASN